jgi:hypothetical protein
MFDLGAQGDRKELLKKGAHAIVIRESDGAKEIERMTFDIPSVSILDALMHDRLFVYNVASMSVFRRSAHGYAKNVEDSTYAEEFIGMQRFFEQRDVDYAFERPPDEIKMDSGTKVEEKIAFQVAKDIPLSTYAVIRLREGRADEAKSAIKQAVLHAPCDSATRQTELYVASTLDSIDAASAAARQWITDCAGNDLEAHRAYQEMESARGRQSELYAEYRNRLAAAPDSAEAHYLAGRSAPDVAVSLAEHREAIRLDPKFAWPRVALGYVLADEERYDEAMRELEGALSIEGHTPAVLVYYARAAIGKGSPVDAMAKVEERLKADPNDYAAQHARWLLAVAAGEWVRAEAMLKTLGEMESPGDTWARRLTMTELQGDAAAADQQIESGLKQEQFAWTARQAQVDRMLAKGDYAAAGTLLREHAKEFDADVLTMRRLYAAGGLMLNGDSAAAQQLLAEAEKGLDPKTSTYYLHHTLLAGLNGTMPAEQVSQIAREQNAFPHGWFVSGVRAAVANDRRRAAECFARAARGAGDLAFPYQETKKMAELMRPQ